MRDLFKVKEMKRMHDEMEYMFTRVFGQMPLLDVHGFLDVHKDVHKDVHSGAKEASMPAKYRRPMTNLYETDKAFIVSVELPGVEKKDIDLNIAENRVEINVEHKAEKKREEKGAYEYAASSRKFYNSFYLPKKIDIGKVKASYKNGILRLEMPKLSDEKYKGRKIQVE